MERTDYTKNQMQYTLLKKEKINLNTGETIVQYDRLTPKTTKNDIVKISWHIFLKDITDYAAISKAS